jgi:hypothetical protein
MGGALIAAAAALIVFWLTAFVGEDYRRWRDSKALAAALAGEVESLKIAAELGIKTLKTLLKVLADGHTLARRAIPEPPESLYQANLERIGLLGLETGRDLPFAYHMIYAYRVATAAALNSDSHAEQEGGLTVALQMVENANDVLPRLLTKLQTHARSRWMPFRS